MATGYIGTHIHTIPSSMGGGWIVPITLEGEQAMESFFNEEATYLCPIGKTGWIVEPWQIADLADFVKEQEQ